MVPCAQRGQRARSTPVSRRRRVRQSRGVGGGGVVRGAAPARRRRAWASAVGTWRAAKRPKWRIFTKPAGKTWSKKRRRNSRGGTVTLWPCFAAEGPLGVDDPLLAIELIEERPEGPGVGQVGDGPGELEFPALPGPRE